MVSLKAISWLTYLQVSFLNTILTFIFPRIMQPDRVAMETITDSCHKVYGTKFKDCRNAAHVLLGWGTKCRNYETFLFMCILKPEPSCCMNNLTFKYLLFCCFLKANMCRRESHKLIDHISVYLKIPVWVTML